MTAGRRDDARRRIRDRADPTLLAHIEGYVDRAARLVPRAEKPKIEPRAAPVTGFRLGAWNLRLAGEPRQVERPPQIADDLQHRTPQAILRDLHRPVRAIPPIRLRHVVSGIDPGAASAKARAAMATRYTVRLADQPSSRRMLADARRSLREILDAPWERALPDEPATATREPGPEDALWFGAWGGVDPDQ